MYDENNIFAKILRNEIPCDKIYENETSLFFKDINPQAKIHILGIPKLKCVDLVDFTNNSNDREFRSFFETIDLVVSKLGIKNKGFRVITNSGEDGAQEVPHFHVHILAGEKLGSIK